uniref:Uncharacterized protein n=1 Tax=Glossina pallidipes TaxID=7398 RepID=A0A1A9ZS43_GLOPL
MSGAPGAPLRSKCRTLTKRNAATNEATANTSKSITRPPTKLGTDIQIVSGSAIRGLTVKSAVSRRLRTPRKSSRPSTERGRPPNDTKFPPSKSSLRFTVLYCPACPGNGGGERNWTASLILLVCKYNRNMDKLREQESQLSFISVVGTGSKGKSKGKVVAPIKTECINDNFEKEKQKKKNKK